MSPLRRLYSYLRRHRRAYLLGLAIVVPATACAAIQPPLIGWMVGRLEAQSGSKAMVLGVAGILALSALLRAGLLFVGRYQVLAASRRVEFDLRNDLYAHLETLSARWFDANATGEITSRAINDLEGVRTMIGIGIMGSFATGLLFLVSLAGMLATSPFLALLFVLPLLGVSAVMAWTGVKMHSQSLAVQEQLGVLSSRAQENFMGARVVRAFVQEENEIARYRAASEEYRARNLRMARWRSGQWAAILLLAEGAMVVTLLVAGKAIIGRTLSVGVLTTFAGYQFQLLWPMIGIGWVISILQRGVVCMGRLAEIFDAKPDSDDSRSRPGAAISGRLEARNLTFAYSADRAPALKDVSFSIQTGQKVAVVGRTGAGKSTIVQLLLRHYTLPDGMLFLDGRDVNTIPLAELRGAIGSVPQDLFLFSDKIRENIAFGGVNGVGDDAIARAADISRLAADLEQFPDRLDQVIGERGVTLSGGQKQRTALARAVVREPRILVLDDALSAVDSHTEQEIQERLREYMKGRTTLVITHRLSAIADADLILVLDDGRLVEQGRHAELLAAGGAYAALWESQKLSEELASS
ncbi:MAG TPA: ABC transporter ATP-binding protein [Planctomycetota bacterium]|jgi:ATP-binding cassette subfamily B protein|nr:ABC transporter ATP-binding protein [Planctomycetota bacterium]